MTDGHSIGFDDDMSMEDLIPDDDTVIAMTNLGYIKTYDRGQFQEPESRRKGNQGNADHR